MKKLPLGIQTFAKIRTDDYLYVDKTHLFNELLNTSPYVFLSRPRRFGKSLLVSTLEEWFLGHHDLFKGLGMEKQVSIPPHPVIRIDFSLIPHDSEERLIRGLTEWVTDVALYHGLKLEKTDYDLAFAELIFKLWKTHQRPVVVLIDEYDKAILDNLSNPTVAQQTRDILRNFYTVLKGSDAYLKWVFLTGVSKFTKLSLFSGLNNLQDVSLDERFATLLGISQTELEDYFADHLTVLQQKFKLSREVLLERIRFWYNGYSWDGVSRLYNPFSLLNLFSTLRFGNYWFASGTPRSLIDLVKTQQYDLSRLEHTIISEYLSDTLDLNTLDLPSLLFQTGYLTIQQIHYDSYDLSPSYQLVFPNFEVKKSWLNYLLADFTQQPVTTIQPVYVQMLEALEKENLETFIQHLRVLFAKIPYTLHLNKEAYYHSLFYMILTLMGVTIDLEVLTDKGRIDGVLELTEKIYVIEFKYGATLSQLTQQAMAQLKDRRYAERYLATGKKILLLGVAFSDKKIDYQVETL